MKQNFIEYNIIILSKQTLDLFLKQDNPADLIALYCFYYYTAKWQGTNQPKATTDYAAKGLKWGLDKTRKNKKYLVNLALIQDVQDKDKQSGKVKGWYIKINYLWKQENHPIDFPGGGSSHRVDKYDPNALSANNINTLSAGSKMLATPSVAGTDIQFLLDKFKSVNPAYERLFKNTTERASLTRLVTKYGVEKVGRTIDALSVTNAEQYAPTITTPYQLEKNLGRLIAFVQKQRGKTPLAIRI